MATEQQRLVTEAKLKNSTPGIIENEATGRRALVFPTGTAEVGDTGWVDIRGAMTNGWTAEVMRVRRMGNRTLLRWKNLDATAATSDYFVSLPYGYGVSGARDYMYALAGSARFIWANGMNISSSRSSHAKSSTESELVLHVDTEPWPTNLGGPRL